MAEEALVVIRPGRADEGARLKKIAIVSKAHWGYELDRVEEWAERGDFSPGQLRLLTVFVAEAGGVEIGWVSLERKDDVWWLGDLWVVPEWIGRGVGSHLFRQAASFAREQGAKALEWEAEPNSVGFYAKMGAIHRRDGTSEWGRTLSVMGIDLDG
jgi:GNAT superfamily N-acetyltransferase